MNTSDGAGSSVPRRQLGRRLRALREKSGMRADQVADTIDVSRQTLWRMENGDPSVKYGRAHIEALCRAYQVDAQTTANFVALAAETKAKGWWHAYGDVIPEGFELYVDLEAAASSLRWYESELVPGLLQTPAYAAAIVGAPGGRDEQEIARRVELRMARQKVLTRTAPQAPRLEIILNEAILRRPVGGAVLMAAQLKHINDIGHLPNVVIRVVPFAFGFHTGITMGPFVIMDFPRVRNGDGEPATVYVDGFTGDLYLDRPSEVGRFAEGFNELANRSLNEADSRVFLARAAEELQQR
ncbi:transcriptional regulator [Longispora fulva]|uniref:Transcriptional regulator with XRE-family HTH domain n=2 Tax=Longispora fulva TaxID=619741 RepID=A0A8J7GSF8_9ACTN|nr:helix-turn-helix transcriptional regulator [Longispora fulva]MBG6137413.1 transcriptional regulator with XRE-family HTH domain [Longispora fulva]GIG61232.1 transcriptional regulator [Longispora fulva]